jgi:uncharacterized protein
LSSPYKFEPELIQATLSGLSRRYAVTFAAACCERMLPNYQAFSKAETWGDFPLFQTALDEVWNYVLGAPVSAQRLKRLLSQCEAVVPDTEDFDTLWASHALDASASVCETLELCLDGDVEHAVTVATSSRDSVDMFIQERDGMEYSDPYFEQKILGDALMVRELKRQVDDLTTLRQHPVLSNDMVKAFRGRYQGQSNLS